MRTPQPSANLFMTIMVNCERLFFQTGVIWESDYLPCATLFHKCIGPISVDFQILGSQLTALDSFDNLSTVVSGYRGTTLVKSVTENYPGAGNQLFTGLNIDGVDRITFSTTDTTGYLDPYTGNPIVAASYKYPDAFVDQLKVSNFKAAPEIDPASALTALTLLLGCLAVLRGRTLKSA